MGAELFEIGSISSRGQIAIPSDIRKNMGLEEGTKVLFVLENAKKENKIVNRTQNT